MSKKKKLKKPFKRFLLICILVMQAFMCFELVDYFVTLKKLKPNETHEHEYYYAYDFGFLDRQSNNDYNSNKIDDYTDILIGLKNYAIINPSYANKYYGGGYPPENEGVCTDTIWFALKEAGYDLKKMIDADILQNKEAYGIDIIDQNIDFRRVNNQDTFFKRYVKKYSTDMNDIMEFNPGDILVFNTDEHIAMTSDKRNANGIPYLIQNRDETQTEKEEDRLEETEMEITSHYRFTYNENLEKLINSIKE